MSVTARRPAPSPAPGRSRPSMSRHPMTRLTLSLPGAEENTMATPIQTTVAPQPVREQTGEFRWTIPLSAAPSREWLKPYYTPPKADLVYMAVLADYRLIDTTDRGTVRCA